MRLLVLGGTAFLSHAVAAEGVTRGHDVVCAARGESGTVPDGAQLITVDRDVPGSLDPLVEKRFDAVVDVARSLGWVREALRVCAPYAAHWTFVSSINVYADTITQGQGPDSPVLAAITDEVSADTPESYGGIKVACEDAVRESMGDRAFVVRSGLITGPGDLSDRFGYWAARFARGGRVAVPDVPDQLIQHIDVRDLATWIVDAGEQGIVGTHNGIGPVTRLSSLLAEIAELVAPAGTEMVAIPPTTLQEHDVSRWMGPKSLPLWTPESHTGFTAHDCSHAQAAGLRLRPLADTVSGALETERDLGLDRPRKTGLTPEDEADVLRDSGDRVRE